MTDDDRTRLYVTTDTRDAVNARRRGGETQDEVVRRALAALDDGDDVLLPEGGGDIDTEALAEDLAAKLREVRETDADELTPLEEVGGDHPERERWDGQVDALPYETEAFDGGEHVEITYETVDGGIQTFPGEVGEYMSHNSWLLIFGEDVSPEYRRPDFIVRRDGVVLIEPYPDGDLFQVGRCESVREVSE